MCAQKAGSNTLETCSWDRGWVLWKSAQRVHKVQRVHEVQTPSSLMSRRVTRLEDVIDGASPIAVLGAVLSGASGASVPGEVIDGASSVSVWKNKLDSTRADTVLRDVIDCASGESVLGYVTWTGGTSSMPFTGDVLDSDSANVVYLCLGI
jgi:hypothetical protein